MKYKDYIGSTDPDRFVDDCPCISCQTARDRVAEARAKIDRERGIYPSVTVAPIRDILASSLGERGLETAETLTGAVPDMQKNLRDFREAAGNPIPPAAVSPRPLSAVAAMQNNDAQQKSPDYLFRINVEAQAPKGLTFDYKKLLDQIQWPSTIGFCDNGSCAHEKRPSCKNWIATHGYKVGEERRKEGGYATLMTNMEMLTALYPEQFPETPEETEKRRDREWAEYCRGALKAMRTEKENYDALREEREREQRVRRNERLRIADILDRYAPLADPRKIANYIRSL